MAGLVNVVARVLKWMGIALLVLILGTVGYEYAAGWRSAALDQRLVAEGTALYASHCAVCHGQEMQGQPFSADFAPPPLHKKGWAFWFYVMPKDTEGFMAKLIGSGRRQMPAFDQLLTPEQRLSLAVLIHRVNAGAVHLP
ncbi:MAG TPA: cytochrome c [bacterium]|nr:cytochrome c [bacterium]